jgi:toxin ParE1/3/4
LTVWVYSAEQWGPDQADRYVDTLLKRFQWLAENRSLWQTRPEIFADIHSFPEQRHVIYLRELGSGTKGIEILRVLHGRMDPMRHP